VQAEKKCIYCGSEILSNVVYEIFSDLSAEALRRLFLSFHQPASKARFRIDIYLASVGG
jgi:hypothetical protein